MQDDRRLHKNSLCWHPNAAFVSGVCVYEAIGMVLWGFSKRKGMFPQLQYANLSQKPRKAPGKGKKKAWSSTSEIDSL